MKNMSDKAKRGFIVTAGILLCIALIFMIGSRMQSDPAEVVPVQETNNQTEEVSIDDNVVVPTVVNESSEKEDVVVEPIDIDESAEEIGTADDNGTEQTIQPDIPEKQTYTEEQLSDSTQTPDGVPVDPPQDDETGTEEVVQTPVEAPVPSATQSSGGLPGFDSVPDGGSGQVIEATDMYENGNKIGNMD
ncbi:MAG: hypothetical protein CVU95_01375 [Firmicutes bacterium HGW-Firmicutes-2]|jgi:hypothetical protein|nr:MAG: hypothetical protein CVU95_01375 [Firmicutes bacterium HGW-Firmicutes-2]